MRMLAAARPDLRDESARRWHEANALNLIFGKIWRSVELD